jgi:hypothetical protein
METVVILIGKENDDNGYQQHYRHTCEE